jgi:hypothetical protein
MYDDQSSRRKNHDGIAIANTTTTTMMRGVTLLAVFTMGWLSSHVTMMVRTVDRRGSTKVGYRRKDIFRDGTVQDSSYVLRTNDGSNLTHQLVDPDGDAKDHDEDDERSTDDRGSRPTVRRNGSLVCDAILASPLHRMWQHRILPTLFSKMFEPGHPVMENETIRDWYTSAVAGTFSFTDWKTTIVHPPERHGFGQILELLDAKLRDPSAAPPVRVLVYGGSVALGHGCGRSLAFPSVRENGCGWVQIMQRLALAYLGGGANGTAAALDIVNLAQGGGQSQLSAGMLEIEFFPDHYPPGAGPDVIIWSHAVNDQYSDGPDDLYLNQLQRFHLAARRAGTTDSCNGNNDGRGNRSHLPLIVYVNDLGGQGPAYKGFSSMRLGWVPGALNMLVSWFGAMAVGVDRLLLPHYFSQNPAEGGSVPLLDGDWGGHHGGIMNHVLVASTLAFNLLAAAVDVCHEEEDVGSPFSSMSTDGIATGAAAAGVLERMDTDRPPHTLNRLTARDLSRRFVPPLSPDVGKESIPQAWLESIHQHDRECSGNRYVDAAVSPPQSNSRRSKMVKREKCPYTWMVVPYASVARTFSKRAVATVDQLHERMEEILVQKEGWEAIHSPDGKEKLGFTATRRGASFQARIVAKNSTTGDDVNDDGNKDPSSMNAASSKTGGQQDVKGLLHLYVMKSYDGPWKNATIRVVLTSNRDNRNQSPPVPDYHDDGNTITHYVSGFNDKSQTSPVVFYQLPVPPLMTPDDSLTIQVDLIKGYKFKIMGMSLCPGFH